MRGIIGSIPAEGGAPFQEVVSPDAPAAGASFSHKVDPRYRTWLLSAVFTLTTSAVVANRYVALEYRDGTGTAIAVNAAGVVVLASSTQRFAGSSERGSSEWAANTDVLFPILPLEIAAGMTVNIAVTGIDAADTLTGLRLVFWRVRT